MADLEKALESYVSSRYRDYFTDQEHRSASALPMLKDAMDAVERMLAQVTHDHATYSE